MRSILFVEGGLSCYCWCKSDSIPSCNILRSPSAQFCRMYLLFAAKAASSSRTQQLLLTKTIKSKWEKSRRSTIMCLISLFFLLSYLQREQWWFHYSKMISALNKHINIPSSTISGLERPEKNQIAKIAWCFQGYTAWVTLLTLTVYSILGNFFVT